MSLNTQKYATEGDMEIFLQPPNTSLNHRQECTQQALISLKHVKTIDMSMVSCYGLQSDEILQNFPPLVLRAYNYMDLL